MKPATKKQRQQRAASRWRDYERLEPGFDELMTLQQYAAECRRAARRAKV